MANKCDVTVYVRVTSCRFGEAQETNIDISWSDTAISFCDDHLLSNPIQIRALQSRVGAHSQAEGCHFPAAVAEASID
jgi:hypothetical protein